MFDFSFLDYKNVVHLQSANGHFSSLIKQYVNEFGDNSKAPFDSISEELICTIIGIKVLEEVFKDDKLKWKLIVFKSKKLLITQLSLPSFNLID